MLQSSHKGVLTTLAPINGYNYVPMVDTISLNHQQTSKVKPPAYRPTGPEFQITCKQYVIYISNRPDYKPEISRDDIKSIIQEAMDAEDITTDEIQWEHRFTSPRNVRYSERFFAVHGFAWFRCPHEDRCWPSAHSWCFIDLKKQKICYRYKQGCKKCEGKVKPEFIEPAITRMARHVVKRYLIRIGELEVPPPNDTDSRMTKGGPHDQKRCDKCKEAGHSCWN